MKIYKLIIKPNTKFRIGSTDWTDSDFMIHSDTLFSGIINCCDLLYGQTVVKKMIDAYKEHKIKHSSVFVLIDIYKNKEFEKTIRFFPKPVGIMPPVKIDKNTNAKVLSTKWVSENIFMEISSKFNEDYKKYEPNKVLEKDNIELFSFDLKKNNFILDNNFIYSKEEFGFEIERPFLQTIVTTKNKIDRTTGQVANDENGKGQLFKEIALQLNQVEQKKYIIKPHFYFLADFADDFELINEFNASLRLLADEGLGGERALGYGKFEKIEFKNFEIKNNFDWSKNRLSLSLINPNLADNEQENIVFYDSIIRSGWWRQQKKKSVRMIKEGSFFKNKINGRLVEVLNEKVLQNGIAFF